MSLSKTLKKQLWWICIYAIAMGFLEAVVVIYLRELYYSAGFAFPLKAMPIYLVWVEVIREAATIIMIVAVSVLASKNKWQAWGYFLITFAVWDIVYYVALKICLNWPMSLFTWDVLFLIPITWVGPVITPVLIAIAMAVLGYYLIKANAKTSNFPIEKSEMGLLLAGGLICIVSFTLDYSVQLFTNFENVSFSSVILLSETYIPKTFNWGVYGVGLTLIVYGVVSYVGRFNKVQSLM